MTKRGSILLHVLVTGALIALIAATLMRMAMLRYQVTAHATNGSIERRYDEAALSLLITQWNTTNVYCATVPGYYTCSGALAGVPAPITSCSCTCNRVISATTTNFPDTVVGGAGGPPCQLTIQSPDMF
ncbi:MAG: hypothetical protein KGJ84_14470 [Elusimicrobia bacterium]|nr:hypothetical protein [Elusimicrobiota bacterium]